MSILSPRTYWTAMPFGPASPGLRMNGYLCYRSTQVFILMYLFQPFPEFVLGNVLPIIRVFFDERFGISQPLQSKKTDKHRVLKCPALCANPCLPASGGFIRVQILYPEISTRPKTAHLFLQIQAQILAFSVLRSQLPPGRV